MSCFFSQIIIVFILTSTAATLHASGNTDINRASELIGKDVRNPQRENLTSLLTSLFPLTLTYGKGMINNQVIHQDYYRELPD